MLDAEKIKKSIRLIDVMTHLLGPGNNAGNTITWKDPVTKEKTDSLFYYGEYGSSGKSGWYSFSTKEPKGKPADVISFIEYVYGCDFKSAVEYLEKNFIPLSVLEEETKKKKKQPKHEDLYKKFSNFQYSDNISTFKSFLTLRGFELADFDIFKNSIETTAHEFGFYEGLYIKDGDYKDVLIVPCYLIENNKKTLVGAKLRRLDNNRFVLEGNKEVKSKTITGSKVGFIFDEIDEDIVILCEGETDYAILKILGFKSVIGNTGGAGSNLSKLADLVKNCKRIVSFYDSDTAGQRSNLELSKLLGRNLYAIDFEKLRQGKEIPKEITKIDINDLFKMGLRVDGMKEILTTYLKVVEFTTKLPEVEKQQVIEAQKTEVVEPKKKKAVSDEDNEDDDIFIWKDSYFVRIETKDSVKKVRLTNFLMSIQDVLIYAGDYSNKEEQRSVRIKIVGEAFSRAYEFKGDMLTTGTVFAKRIASINPLLSTYNISNVNLQKLIRFLNNKNLDSREAIVVTHRGHIAKYGIWVFNNGVFDEDSVKFYPYESEDDLIAKLPKIKILFRYPNKDRITFEEKDYISEPILKKMVSDAEYTFCGKQGHLVIGYFVSCLLFHKVKTLLTPFPILFVGGKKASGKTTAIQLFIKAFGFDYLFPENFEKSTAFIDQKSITEMGAIPIWRDEYKNVAGCIKKDGFLKSVFDRSGISKGRQDLSQVDFPVNAPMLLSGEQFPKDDAVFSRILPIYVSGNRGNEGPQKYEELKKNSDYYVTFINFFLSKLDSLEETYIDKFDKIKAILIESGIEKRLLNVFLPGIVGYATFLEMIGETHEIEAQAKDYLTIILDKESNEFSEDIINRFFETILTLSEEGKIYLGNYFTLGTSAFGTVLKFCYQALYSTYRDDELKANRDLIIDKNTLRRYMVTELGATDSNSIRLHGSSGAKRGLIIPIKNIKYPALQEIIDKASLPKDELTGQPVDDLSMEEIDYIKKSTVD